MDAKAKLFYCRFLSLARMSLKCPWVFGFLDVVLNENDVALLCFGCRHGQMWSTNLADMGMHDAKMKTDTWLNHHREKERLLTSAFIYLRNFKIFLLSGCLVGVISFLTCLKPLSPSQCHGAIKGISGAWPDMLIVTDMDLSLKPEEQDLENRLWPDSVPFCEMPFFSPWELTVGGQ